MADQYKPNLSQPYKPSDPARLRRDRAAIRNSLQAWLNQKPQAETNTYAPVSPPEQGVPAPKPKGRRITNVGIVTGFRNKNNPV